METNSYKGWLNSDNFFKRTIAVYLYSLLGNCTVGCIIYALLFVLLFLTGMLGALSEMSQNSNINSFPQAPQTQNFR
jgi:hypothetical protein